MELRVSDTPDRLSGSLKQRFEACPQVRHERELVSSLRAGRLSVGFEQRRDRPMLIPSRLPTVLARMGQRRETRRENEKVRQPARSGSRRRRRWRRKMSYKI